MSLGSISRTRCGRWTAGLVAATALAIQSVSAAPAVTPPPPTCTTARVTTSETAGPYYRPGSPERASLLEPGMPGTRITVTGYVLSTQCRPIAGAWLDFWQADDRGQYDTAGYRLRGHQFTDAAGAFFLETILPGLYSGRTRHIHVKVRAPNGPTLTTQLYFPGEPRNQSDGIFNPGLVVTTQGLADGHVALFNFIVNTR
jgi:protocatechuate 3,4-dioxygenase beta subunit